MDISIGKALKFQERFKPEHAMLNNFVGMIMK
jgi:hypothetical protein